MRQFQYRKYIDLAFGSRPGVVLGQKVEESWHAWVEAVQKAPWLGNWKGLRLMVGHSPYGKRVIQEGAWIAEKVFASTVWGFGVQDWIHSEASAIQREMYRLQGLDPKAWGTVTGSTRAYIWDEEYRQRYGILLPCEVADLDRWLESLV